MELQTLAEQAVIGVFQRLDFSLEGVEIALLACDDTRIAQLNAQFREKPTSTNVLSWPNVDLCATEDGQYPAPPRVDAFGSVELGDIAISFDTCLREAEQSEKPLHAHVLHLIVHGVLHLLGFDHIRDLDATLMESIEVEILEKMGISDPYNITAAK